LDNRYALLIGINRYVDGHHLIDLKFAEKDCEDLRDALIDPALRAFKPENVHVIAGDNATTFNIQAALHRHLVRERKPGDLILVYFSGHGFLASDEQIPYLGSHDVQVNLLSENPNAGVRMDRLHEDVAKSPAAQVICMLDCCYSGAIAPGRSRESVAVTLDQSIIPEAFLRLGQGRVALVSCPPESVSRESEGLQNGVFTHFVLRGLRGEACEPDRSDVTFDSLVSFLRRRLPPEQSPGSFGQSFGRIVLSSPGRASGAADYEESERVLRPGTTRPKIEAVQNPLERYFAVLQDLLARLQEPREASFADATVLDAIRSVAGAEQAAVLRWQASHERAAGAERLSSVREIVPEQYSIVARKLSRPNDSEIAGRADRALDRTIDAIANSLVPHFHYHNVRLTQEGESGAPGVIIAPVAATGSTSRDFLVLSGLADHGERVDESMVHLFTALYKASNGLTALRQELVEAAVLDDLKQNYFSYVPLSWYERRFKLFQDRLKGVTTHYQPILYLQPQGVYISGWEALAREAGTGRTPLDIFVAAETWGTRFLTELDLHCTEAAVRNYVDALGRVGMRRPTDIQDLSVNVYPTTVLRRAYRELLSSLLEKYPLRKKLILEISEKRPIPSEVENLAAYRDKLQHYVKDLEIAFAIDDFGVGYSSIERLATLAPSYVKIDREVLHLQTGHHAIEYVLRVTAEKKLHPVEVVIEGFDGDSDISLGRLYALGVRYVQGFTIGKAGPELYRINRDDAVYLDTLLKDRGARAARRA
jgi:EAL domain-containing protein (putative c-di-GMP-specific phosphodiesterase class I)